MQNMLLQMINILIQMVLILYLTPLDLEVSRQQAIEVVAPGGSIIHIGLTQPAGTFNFRKLHFKKSL